MPLSRCVKELGSVGEGAQSTGVWVKKMANSIEESTICNTI